MPGADGDGVPWKVERGSRPGSSQPVVSLLPEDLA